MTPLEAKEQGYTHTGKIYGVPVYLTNDADMNIVGINWFYYLQVQFFTWLDVTFEFNDCFVIKIENCL